MKMFLTDDPKQIYDVDHSRSTQICPMCNDQRKNNKNQKCLTVRLGSNPNDGTDEYTAFCHHCNKKLVEWKDLKLTPQRTEPLRYAKKTSHIKPSEPLKMELSTNTRKYLESRCIDPIRCEKLNIYTAQNEWMPKAGKKVNTIAFPHYVDSELITTHFRGQKKDFKFTKNTKICPWNLDSIKGSDYAIITEGRIDALSWISSGFESAVSVPNGASKSTEYLDDYIHLFDDVDKIYIAVDDDEKGKVLQKELARRFGYEKSYIIEYGGLKDSNQLLVESSKESDFKDTKKYNLSKGYEALKKAFEEAKAVEIDGILRISQMNDEIDLLLKGGLKQGAVIGHSDFDTLCSFETGRVAVMTGVPNHGKSEFVDEIMTRLNNRYGWKAGIFSPENKPHSVHYAKVASKLTGFTFDENKIPPLVEAKTRKYADKNFAYITPIKEVDLNGRKVKFDDFRIDVILSKFISLVKVLGIKMAVIDPWNRLEDQKPAGMSTTEFVGKILIKIISFAQTYDVFVLIVAHPRKMEKEGNKPKVPTPYDIADSANFFNMVDYCLTTYRHMDTNLVELHIQKIKFRHLGKIGLTHFNFNERNGRYIPCFVDEDFVQTPEVANNEPYKCLKLTPEDLEQNPLETQEDLDAFADAFEAEGINIPF